MKTNNAANILFGIPILLIGIANACSDGLSDCNLVVHGYIDDDSVVDDICLTTDESTIKVDIFLNSENESSKLVFDHLFGSTSSLYELGNTLSDFVRVDGGEIYFQNLAQYDDGRVTYYVDVSAKLIDGCLYFSNSNIKSQCMKR